MAEEVFIFPCSFAQQRLWFLDQLEPNSAYYNIPLAVRLQGHVNVPVLEQCLNEVVRRHETLRTRFRMIDGQPVQVIVPSLKFELLVRDLEEPEVLRLATEEIRKPFDLTVAPLLRGLLLRLSDDDYILTLTLHHIVGDGWSLGILIREITLLYGAFMKGEPSPLPELPIQYADFADWEQQWLQGELLEEQLSYWERKLAGELPVIELPTDHPRPRVSAHQGARYFFDFPLDLTEKLKTLARDEEATLFMTVLAAFNVMLNRYTGQKDITVGVPNANRNQIETEGLVGFFVNTLVMRTDISGELSFRELLGRVRDTVLEADAHREVPFEKLVERLQPERNLAQNPLFQVMFHFQNEQMASLTLPAVTANVLELETGTAKFDLILTLSETPRGLCGSVQYDTELFEAETMKRMMGHYQNLLQGIVVNPEQLVSRLSMLSEAETRQLAEWNDTSDDEVPQQCLHDLFAAQVQRTPEALAVSSGEQSLTYGELDKRANQVANHLRKLGVGPDVRVGLCLEPSLEMAAGVLGVLKAGGAYVPLDPAYPRERIAFMIRDSRARVVLTQSWLVHDLPDDIELECLDQSSEALGAESENLESSDVLPENLAYVIYTSGSTGVPKGVAMSHWPVVNLIWWQIKEPGFSGSGATTQFHSFSFDVSCQEMFSTWATGGTLVMIPEEERKDVDRFLEVVTQSAVERLFLPPAALHQLTEASLDQTIPGSLRQIVAAGEQLQIDEPVIRLFERLENCVLHNQYGPTENAVITTSFSLPASPGDWPRTPPIGRPLPNTQVHLLDDQLQRVPVGVPGHLYIGGLRLARGYLDKPHLTAERFIPDPLSTEPGARLYVSGDLARYLPDGNIEFLGRIDHQVKIRGFRIEPAEVEAVLKRHPAVQDAVVVVRELSHNDNGLVGYLVLDHDSAPPSTTELHRFVGEILPSYMIPSAFVFLDALPMTPSGKVDRRSLPAPGERTEECEERALTPIEEVVAGTWCDVLGISRVGREEDFFELGGHSLLATRVVSRLRDIFNVDVPVRRMFETPTVAGLSTSIELANGNGRIQQMPAITRAERNGEIPLSFSQQRLWFLDQLEPGSPFYNLSTAFRIHGLLNVAALEQAFAEVLRRHESLRTTFASADGRPFQIISSERPQRLPITDLSELPDFEREIEAQRLANEESQMPFDLATGPLFRVRLLRLGADRHLLVLTIHHIISDGWSNGVLVKELAALYQAYSANQPSPLPDLPIQYADYSYSQREWLQGEPLERQLSYWKEQLAGAPTVLELPADLPRPAIQTFRGLTHNFELPADLTGELKKLSRREGSTLFMTLLSAFSMLLSRYTGQEDLIVGTAVANRDQPATEDLIGIFFNTLPMRVDLSGNPGFEDLLKRVRETALGAYSHQALPFERLIDELQLKRDTSRSPLVQVMLILQNVPLSTVELPGLTLTPIVSESRAAKLDLILSISEDAGTLHCALEYNTDLFKAATIERLAGHFRTILEGIVADPHRRIRQYQMLTATECSQLSEWTGTRIDNRQRACIHELFEKQVARVPHAIAVSHDETRLTYAELNRRANQLARHLQSLGVGPEVRVGICVERCAEMMVGILGILKAGGAYVPIDVEYPRERVSFMLADAHVGILLTKEALLPTLPSHQAQTLCLDSDWITISRHSDENVSTDVKPENLAYVIYTSGSTGQPKGVMVCHRNVVHLFAAIYPGLNFEEREVWTVVHSFAFDFSVWEIWGALLHGGELVIVPLWTTRTPEAFYELLKSRQVTVLSQTPSAFNQWAGPNAEITRSDEDLAIRLLVLGGEALPPEIAHELFKREHPVWNFYGPTEATVWALTHRLDPSREVPHAIGTPIPNMESHILDRHGMPVPVGVPGELYLGGDGLGRGYLNRPELTAEKFVPHASSNEAGTRLYRTGDLARYLPDGRIEYLGRIDEQVKVRGYRVEPGEIEAAICEHEAVREAVVVARHDSVSHRLIAYLVAEPGRTLATEQLREGLREKLPEYMVPAAFVMLEELPLSPNGKLDRRALPAYNFERTGEHAFTVAETAEELALVNAWTRVLGVEQISVHDNFFDLGGDSIRCIQVRAETHKQGYDFSVQQLFQHQTISKLGKHLTPFEGGATGVQTQPFSLISEADRVRLPETAEDAYPLARLQHGMLFHSELSPDTSVYHDILSFHLRTPFAEDTLRESLHVLVSRHPVLRTAFDLVNYEEPLQLVLRSVDVSLSVVDLSELAPEQQEQRLADWVKTEKQNPFEWTRPPYVRFAVFIRSGVDFQFVLSYHHAILDGWSLVSLLTELFTIYSTRLSGGEVVQPPLRALYRDFIALERDAIESPESRNYWDEKLAGAVATRWPERDPLSHAAGDMLSYETQFSPEFVDKLREFARSAVVSLKHVLLAAHLRVLSLLSGRSEVLTGLVSNGRPEKADGERVLGLFLNVVPLSLSLAGGTWIDLVQSAQKAEEEMFPFRRYPLAELQHRHDNGSLLEITFNFSHFHAAEALRGFDNLEILGAEAYGRTNFPVGISFTLNPNSSQLLLRLESNEEKADEESLQAAVSYFSRIFAAMIEQPLARYETFSPLPENELRQLQVEWNDTKADYPRTLCLHEMFEAQVERTPEATAVTFENEQFTYRELDERANQLARHLRALGVRPEVTVGILMERSMEMAVALLAVLKAGGAYVPLDPDYPSARLSFMIDDSRTAVVLTQEHVAARLETVLSDFDGDVVAVDTSWSSIAKQSRERLDHGASSENLVYVIYTSGSTGQPKGAMLNHRGIVNCVLWMQETYQLDASDSFLLKTSLNFDPSVWEFFWPLSLGARVVIARSGEQADTAYLLDLIAKHQITSAYFVPSMLRLFLDDPRASTATSLKRVISGGEKLPVETIALFFDTLRAELHHSYGPTETSIAATEWTCDREQPRRVVTIGRPLANTEIHVLDPHVQPVPAGVAGALYIGGDCLGRGYLHRADLTAEKFVPHPFSDEPGARLYQTGDLVRYLRNGEVEFLGRVDQQVKIRGYRIEPGEIEAALRRHPLVSDCLVLVRGETTDEKQLIAYVVAPERSLDVSELRRHLKEHVPAYMIPSAFVLMDQLPLMPNGKIDRRALPDPETTEPETAYAAPRTAIEEIIAGLWQELLKVERVGIDADFFELGGHSLLATQLVSRVREVFQVEIPLRRIFEYPTVESLAEYLANGAAKDRQDALPPIQPITDRGDLDVSFAQQRLWILHQLDPQSAAFNVPIALRLTGKLDVAALKQTLAEVVRRHEVLRTVFTTAAGRVVQVVNPHQTTVLPVEDLSGLQNGEREAEVRRLVREATNRPFDLRRGPLMRSMLLRLSEQEHVLSLTLHHIVCDAWSIGVVFRELATLYQSFSANLPSPLPELAIQYADFAAWQKQLLEDVRERQLAYWRRQLSDGFPVLNLPVDKKHAALQGFRGAAHTFSLAEEVSESLKALSRRQGATLFMSLLAAFKLLLFHHTEQPDILIGANVAGRTRIETENLIGFFVNMVPLRTPVSGDPKFTDLLARVRNTALGAYAHQEVPFEQLLEELTIDRRRSPLQVAFTFDNTPHEPIELPELSIELLEVELETTRLDLVLALSDGPNGIRGSFQYHTDLFNASTISRMAEQYELLLRLIVDQPEANLSVLRRQLAAADGSREAAKRREFREARSRSLRKLKQVAGSGVV